MSTNPEDQKRTMLANIPDKTGKALADWLVLLKNSELEKHGQLVKLLKTEHQVTHGFANLIVHEYLNQGSAKEEVDLLDVPYARGKEGLIPLRDELIKIIKGLGGGVEIAPKKNYVSLRHKKQFALVQPSTKTRIDLGINLKGVEPVGKLQPSGSLGSMVSHKIAIHALADIDDEVEAWLKRAFEAAC
ncbi:MAG: DUF4287 domain-containing protein [Alteromonadaceae bacterium]|nr:DUF4287 domain-containing protein [Alteromonadaceae bacterium]